MSDPAVPEAPKPGPIVVTFDASKGDYLSRKFLLYKLHQHPPILNSLLEGWHVTSASVSYHIHDPQKWPDSRILVIGTVRLIYGGGDDWPAGYPIPTGGFFPPTKSEVYQLEYSPKEEFAFRERETRGENV